jgi:hypothetical protein
MKGSKTVNKQFNKYQSISKVHSAGSSAALHGVSANGAFFLDR